MPEEITPVTVPTRAEMMAKAVDKRLYDDGNTRFPCKTCGKYFTTAATNTNPICPDCQA